MIFPPPNTQCVWDSFPTNVSAPSFSPPSHSPSFRDGNLGSPLLVPFARELHTLGPELLPEPPDPKDTVSKSVFTPNNVTPIITEPFWLCPSNNIIMNTETPNYVPTHFPPRKKLSSPKIPEAYCQSWVENVKIWKFGNSYRLFLSFPLFTWNPSSLYAHLMHCNLSPPAQLSILPYAVWAWTTFHSVLPSFSG